MTGSDSAPAKANEASQKNAIGAARDDVQLTAVNALQEAYEAVYVADGVSAGNAKTTVGKNVIKALYDKYGDETQVENATVEVTVQGVASSLDEITGGTISIYTTDFEVVGTVELSGGVITWGEIEDNIPGIKIINIPDSVGINEEKTLSIKRKHVSESAPVTWTSETTSKATINQNTGVVKGIAEGTSKITASITDGETTYTAECTIKVELSKADKINKKIGEEIAYDRYDATKYNDTWKIFYANSEEMFIITSSVVEASKVGFDTEGIPITDTEDSMGSLSIANSTYGRKYNKLWLQQCEQIDANNQILNSNSNPKKNDNKHKAVAYLCNPNHWTAFKTSSISNSYAVGGPTYELFIASWNKVKSTNITPNKDAYGYIPALDSNYSIATNDGHGVFIPDSSQCYWIASPYYFINYVDNVLAVGSLGKLIRQSYFMTSYNVRPLVSIPLSNVLVDDSGNVSIKRDDGTIMITE